MITVDFATFCHGKDAHRLHAPGQLKKQILSNNYPFNKIIIVHQCCNPVDYKPFALGNVIEPRIIDENDIDLILSASGIDLSRRQYKSDTDKAHEWRYHVINHLRAIRSSVADYIVFADNDCWMRSQPSGRSWIDYALEIFALSDNIFCISPNDGEPERSTRRMSQQMFMVNVEEFRNADFNQPDWDGNVNIEGGPMPEYWAMLEGRMELHCRKVGKYRYVLPPEYRYWHFNKLTEDNLFETDYEKY
jgi:hypothetical protein